MFFATSCQASLTGVGQGKRFSSNAFAWKICAGIFEDSVLLVPSSCVRNSVTCVTIVNTLVMSVLSQQLLWQLSANVLQQRPLYTP